MCHDHDYSINEIKAIRKKVLCTVSAKIIAHSISPAGVELLTMEVKLPRMVLAELNTHREFDRNSASSRAIPVERQLRMIVNDLYLPFYFGANQSGMQANAELSGDDLIAAVKNWMTGRDLALLQAVSLMGGVSKIKDSPLAAYLEGIISKYKNVQSLFAAQNVGLHKQNANRVLEPYMWHTVVITATNWSNFYSLRCDHDAQPEIRTAALSMIKAHSDSEPKKLNYGEWHLPYLNDDEKSQMVLSVQKKVSTGRTARTSYLTHDGSRDFAKDIDLYDSLLVSGHMSPFGHIATPAADQNGLAKISNLVGWCQYRSEVLNQDNFAKVATDGRLLKGLDGNERLLSFLKSLER